MMIILLIVQLRIEYELNIEKDNLKSDYHEAEKRIVVKLIAELLQDHYYQLVMV
jgi:hypothetical protein